jgi:DNA-binding NarL/FixJ family response regulator
MPKLIKIIIVDDHPFIIEGYKNAINSYSANDYQFTIKQANDCRSAYNLIAGQTEEVFDIAFFDISMPPYEEKNIFSGEDLALLIKGVMPDCKVVLLTMHAELLKISNIIKTINPSGLIIKNDLTFDELLAAFNNILKGENYYSQTVVNFVSQLHVSDIALDPFDKQILYHLSKGVTRNEITSFVPLSAGAVEKRLAHLMEVFSVSENVDEVLIEKAKAKGLV